MDDAFLEPEVHAVGRRLFEAFPGSAGGPLHVLDERAMEVASRDQELRAALFRFVDVVPACRSLDDLARHLVGFVGELEARPVALEAAMRIAHTRAGRAALGAAAAAAAVRHMAHRFIVGSDVRDAEGVLRELWGRWVATSVDLLGEAAVTRAEADRYAQRCHRTLEALTELYARWPARRRLEADSVGVLPRANLSVKVSALTSLLRPHAPDRGRADADERLRPLLRRARELGAHLHIDMESLDSREAVLELVLDLLGAEEFARGPSSGLVLQAYLRDSPDTLDQVLGWAGEHQRETPLTVRAVKGAYWDHEIVRARQHGWPAPVFEHKRDCDRNFERLPRRLLDARPTVRVAIASHNLRSVAHAIACDRLLGGDGTDLELQVLRGLGDDLQDALQCLVDLLDQVPQALKLAPEYVVDVDQVLPGGLLLGAEQTLAVGAGPVGRLDSSQGSSSLSRCPESGVAVTAKGAAEGGGLRTVAGRGEGSGAEPISTSCLGPPTEAIASKNAPEPSPSSTRPPLRRSRLATLRARTTGGRSGRFNTFGARRMLEVSAAMNDSNVQVSRKDGW